MTKYIVYAEDEDRPVIDGAAYKKLKKFNREYEALAFAGDVRNLARYGCMRLIKTTDEDGDYIWNADEDVWERWNGK